MTPGDRIPVAAILLWFVFFVGLLIVVIDASDGPDPCEIDAPMEQAQCRATRGERPEWLVRR